jgi:hypothetical protein
MNERIMRYPSDALYGGKLRAHPAVARHAIDDAPLEVIDTAGRGFEEETPPGSDSKMNAGEAALAASRVRRLLALLRPQDIAVISPYDAQVQKIRQLLGDVPEVEIDTVDGFQGREKEAIVVSLVRSNDEGQLGAPPVLRRLPQACAGRGRVALGMGGIVANALADRIGNGLLKLPVCDCDLDWEHALLISPRAARRLCDIQAHTLGSSQSLIAQLQIRDRSVLQHHKQFASDLIRSQGFVWKSRPVRTTVEAQCERSELRSSSKSLQAK